MMRNFKKDFKENKGRPSRHGAFKFALRLKKLLVDCIGDARVNKYKKKHNIPDLDGITRSACSSICGWINGVGSLRKIRNTTYLNLDPACLDDESKEMIAKRGRSLSNYERSQYLRKTYGSKRQEAYDNRMRNHAKINKRYNDLAAA